MDEQNGSSGRSHPEGVVDVLLVIRGKQAYAEAEARLNRLIHDKRQPPFAVVLFDVNDLQNVNEVSGQECGDQYLRDACKLVCDTFKHSPVFRVGDDEFAVVSSGSDYERIDELLRRVGNHNVEASRAGGVVIACGMSRFDNDDCVAAVFERADKNMHANKQSLKSRQYGESAKKYAYNTEKRIVLESLQQPFAVYQFVDKRVVTLLVSDGFCRLFGYADHDEAMYDMDNDMYKDAHPDDVARIADVAARFAMDGGEYDVVYRTRNVGKPGYMVIHALGERMFTEDGSRLAHVWYTYEGQYQEGSADAQFEIAKVLSSALYEQNTSEGNRYDNLTGLPTMTYFFELTEARKETILERGGQLVMLYFDFDGMKFFNDKYGFEQGDQLLRMFARMLAHAFGDENCCHIGADRFAVVAEETGIEEKLNGIFRLFGELYGGKTPPVHAGIYPYLDKELHVSAACDRAKLVCGKLKGTYASGFKFYDEKLREEALLKQHVIENIDIAIREKWIQVFLQPIIRSVNERVCDVEALARWVDPEMGILAPNSFIPALEESGLIYKLDLYMVDQVLESIEAQAASGSNVVSHSINLSRADFDACDIVEEIRKRVDAAGVARDRITIEVTESVIGNDFEFMKRQIERFQELGFPVWMDDFGSGYSSLDFLQSINFDLIKFDMSFLRKLDADDSGKVVLADLMRMMTSLGVDTVCEGVETEPQVRFLQEIGCSKLQGFFFSEPLPLETAIRRRKAGTLIEDENPSESDYYESIGRINLHDLSVIAEGDISSMQNTFNALPVGIIEINGKKTRFVRSNQTYRDFAKRFLGFDLSNACTEFVEIDSDFVQNVLECCCEQGMRLFYDETMPDGSVVHSFARQIGVNPVTGSKAIAVAVLSIT